ncbi:MAG: serine/threonine-protein kinase [Pseudomonadota bacterium]
MDWERVAAQTQLYESLSGADHAEFVNALGEDDTLEGAEIRRYVERRALATSFMSTHTPGTPLVPALAPGAMVGVWRITTLLGAGGMGEVYQAERADGLYEQTVAVKVLRSAEADLAARFERERQRLARLDHPGVSRIIDGGAMADGLAFMAMEFVDGSPIDRHVEGLTRADTLGLFVQLCNAVSHAHSKLILHRDLKPQNVLVDSQGAVRLIDFGIAAMLDTDEVSDHGPITFAYAAPEQLLGQPVSVATDIYGLGAVLHALLAGVPPQRRSDGGSDVSRLIDNPELAAIVTRALAFEPGERYPSAATLAADVTAYLDSRPVAAYEGGALYRAKKRVRAAPLASALALTAVLAIIVGTVASLKFALDARAEAEQTRIALLQSQQQLALARFLTMGNVAYSNLILENFSGDNDAELTEQMLSRWRDAHEGRNLDPISSASMSYAIGRLLYLRRDLVNAQQVLGDWIDAEYGPEEARLAGKELLALSVFDSGDWQRAAPLLREIVDAHKVAETSNVGLKRELSDRADIGARLAVATGQAEDVEYATGILLERRDRAQSEVNPEEEIQALGGLSSLLFYSRDYERSLKYLKDILAIYTAHPETAVTGRFVVRHNAARVELFHLGQHEIAAQRLQRVLLEDVALSGENVYIGRVHRMLAAALIEGGAAGEAEIHLDQATALLARYGGEPTEGSWEIHLWRAWQAMEMGDDVSSEAYLAQAETQLATQAPDSVARQRMVMLELYRDLQSGKPIDTISQYAREALTRDGMSDLRNAFFYGKLLELGMPDILAS